MRVTNQMLSNNFLRDMNNNLESLSKIQSQMTSGKEIQKPSDDPFKVARAMQLNTDISANEQYNNNIEDTTNWLDTTDTSLGQTGDILQRMRELLVSTGDPSYGTDEKAAVKNEINQKIEELSQVLNTNYDGKYVFGGTRATTKPMASQPDPTTGNSILSYYRRDGGKIDLSGTASATDTNEYNMINGKLSVEISQGVSMDYSVSAKDVLNFKNSSGATTSLVDVPADSSGTGAVSGLLSRITSDLDNNNTTNLVGSDLTDLSNAITNVLRLRSEVGAKSNRMEDAKSKNQDENYNMTALLSKTEDIDITKKTMEYANMQTVYTASLQTSAKVIQPTLMDYLK